MVCYSNTEAPLQVCRGACLIFAQEACLYMWNQKPLGGSRAHDVQNKAFLPTSLMGDLGAFVIAGVK
mgnify:FL=1